MKKLITLLLAAALMLSLVACGGGGDTTNSVGETVTTDRLEFTLNSVDFATEYTDNSGNNFDYTATDENILAVISFSIKNTGKKSFSFGYIRSIEIDYDDGYTFEQGLGNTSGNPFQVNIDGVWHPVAALDSTDQIEPLDKNSYEYNGYIEVPNEVSENEGAPLNLNIYLYGSDSPDFVFKIR